MTSRDEVLANFQACSGIDDVGQAIGWLEQSNWELMEAVNAAAGFGEQPFEVPQVGDVVQDMVGVTEGTPPVIEAGGAPAAARGIINVTIQLCLPDNTGEFPLELPEGVTSAELKTSLYQLLGVAQCRQRLVGLGDKEVKDTEVVSSANLREGSRLELHPKEEIKRVGLPDFAAEVVDITGTSGASSSRVSAFSSIGVNTNKSQDSSRTAASTSKSNSNSSPSLSMPSLDASIKLKIKDTRKSETLTYSFECDKSVRDVKQRVARQLSIPMSKQRWNGWPVNSTESALLSSLFSVVTENPTLTVGETSRSSSSSKVVADPVSMDADDDDDDSSSDYEDMLDYAVEDSYFDDVMEVNVERDMLKREPLLTKADMELSESECSERFSNAFIARYSEGAVTTPLFATGSLSEALDLSVGLPAADRRLLALYVHDDASIHANVFCSQILCQETTVSYLLDNFVVWGWDITHHGHKDRLMASLIANIGQSAAAAVRTLRADTGPALLVVNRSRGTTEVVSSLLASRCCLDELVTGLMEAVEVCSATRLTELSEERERGARAAILSQQETEFQESLRQDRAKKEKREAEEAEVRRGKEREETELREKEEETEAVRQSMSSLLPDEPLATADDVTVMRFRAPEGAVFSRVFSLETRIEVVLAYTHTKGFPASTHKLLQSWPRRDVTSLDPQTSLRQANFPKQETLTITER